MRYFEIIVYVSVYVQIEARFYLLNENVYKVCYKWNKPVFESLMLVCMLQLLLSDMLQRSLGFMKIFTNAYWSLCLLLVTHTRFNGVTMQIIDVLRSSELRFSLTQVRWH